jgi:pimeloyl-ACP methyl ester carboxylesterase
VRALVSIDGLGITGDGGWAEYDANIASRMSPADAERTRELGAKVDEGDLTDADIDEMVHRSWRYMFADPDTAADPPARTCGPAYAETAADASDLLAAGTLPEKLAHSPVPALFLPGEQSPMPAWAAHQAAAVMPSGQVVPIPRAAHFPFLENAAATREAIVSFLSGSP